MSTRASTTAWPDGVGGYLKPDALKRAALINELLVSLPPAPAKLLRATTQAQSAAYMTAVLKE